MVEKIKDIEVIAYKGIESSIACGGFQYEIGKTYKTDKAELCEIGFHACLNPIDVLDYYPQDENSRYFKVKLSGEITKCGKYYTPVAATEMTILEEINIDEIIKITEWLKHDNVLDLLYWSDGLAVVQRGDGLWNFIDRQGKYLSDEWFENVFNFHDGFAVVQRGDKKYNLIDKKGKYLIDEWFYWADNFHDGLARVQRKEDKKCNYINKNGKIISDEWFNRVFDFKDGFAVVERTNGELCKIDKNGKIVVSK